jgi:hypothetical protein
LPLLPAAAASVSRVERSGEKVTLDSPRGVGVPWTGAAMVDGKPWPVVSDSTVWLARGAHSIQPSTVKVALRLIDLNAELRDALVTPSGLVFTYQSNARALATFDQLPSKIEIDGMAATPQVSGNTMMLPSGQHTVIVSRSPNKQNAR